MADTSYIDTRIAALENMVKGLVMPQQPTNYLLLTLLYENYKIFLSLFLSFPWTCGLSPNADIVRSKCGGAAASLMANICIFILFIFYYFVFLFSVLPG